MNKAYNAWNVSETNVIMKEPMNTFLIRGANVELSAMGPDLKFSEEKSQVVREL